jgi:phosphoenolpyruvate-protein kinase (PTS system EI component)
MSALAIPHAKQTIRALDYASARRVASSVMELDTPEAVRERIRQEKERA